MRPLLALLLCAASLAACSSSNGTSLSGGASDAGPPLVQAIYDLPANTILTPYPSDRYTVPDTTSPTGLRVHIGKDNTNDPFVTTLPGVGDELDAMNGFSTAGGVVVNFTGPVDVHDIAPDPATAPHLRDIATYTQKGSPFYLLDVDPASPEHGKLRGVLARWWAQPKDADYPTDDFTLVAQPATPLLPKTRYLFVTTTALHDTLGRPVARSAETDKLVKGTETGAYADQVKAALDQLEASGVAKRDDVVLATAFTTATMIDEMLATGTRARKAPAPALMEPWTVETPMVKGDPRIRFRAVYASPEYRAPLPDGKWKIGPDGAPIVQKKNVGLEVFLAISDATTSVKKRPVVIFQHGLGGTKDQCWGTAQRLAPLDAAVIAIDSPEHGARASTPNENGLISALSFFGVDQATMKFDIGRARDNFRQMASDQLELVRLIGSLATLDLLPAGQPDGVPDLDVSRILYIGHSFGSVQGATILSLAPEIRQATWNVGGDGLMTLLRDSGTFSLLVNTLRPPQTPDGALGRFFAVTQAIVDPGDPINYARFGALEPTPGVTGWLPRDMLLQEVYQDGIVPNSTSEALARAAGLSLVHPVQAIAGVPAGAFPLTGNLPTGATGAICTFDKATNSNGEFTTLEHGDLIFTPEAIAQYVEFFRSGLANGHATVVDPYKK